MERIGLPDFNIRAMEARVDTGAYTSAIDCRVIESFTAENREMVKIQLADPSADSENEIEVTLPIKKRKKIRSSFGRVQTRIIIEARIRLHGKIFKTDFSLADRSRQKYPVLLGRKAIYKRFVVDVSEKYLSE